MSRLPFWQPGDSWQPPIIRIKGIDEKSPVGQQLMQMYGGPIKQFYQGAARAHYLGTVDNTRLMKQFPDARMTYTNMMGQEIVEVEVRPEAVEEARQQVREGILPDWLLLEFVVDDGSRVRTNITGFVRNPDWHQFDPIVGGAALNTSFGQGHWGTGGSAGYVRDGRVVSAISPVGGPVPAITRTPSRFAPHRNTFVLDLRKLKHLPTISIDFYGWATSQRYTPRVDYYLRDGGVAGAVDDRSGSGTYTYNGGGGPIVTSNIAGMPVGMDVAVAEASYDASVRAEHVDGEIAPSTKSTADPVSTWALLGSGIGVTPGLTIGVDYPFSVDWAWHESIWRYNPIYVIDVDARPVVLDVRNRVFAGGDLDWREVRWLLENDGPIYMPPENTDTPLYPYDQDYRTWELLEQLPNHLSTTHIGNADVMEYTPATEPSLVGDQTTHYGKPYFGTYTLVLEAWSGSWGAPGAGP